MESIIFSVVLLMISEAIMNFIDFFQFGWLECCGNFAFSSSNFDGLSSINRISLIVLLLIRIIEVISTNFLCTQHTDTILDNSELIRNFSSFNLSFRNKYQRPCNAGWQRHCPTASSMGFGATTTTHYTVFLYLVLMLKMVEKDPRKISSKYLFSSLYFFSHVGLISFSFPETLSFFPFTFVSCVWLFLCLAARKLEEN